MIPFPSVIHLAARSAIRPRGHALPKLLTIIVVGGVIWAYKFTAAPASLMARINPRAASSKINANHREFLESLGRLIGQSKQVMAVHDRGATPYVEIVLWRDDTVHPGVIDPAEVALISQSLVTQSISVYTLGPEVPNEAMGRTSAASSQFTSPSHAQASPLGAVPIARPAGSGALPPGQVVTSRSQSITQTSLTPGLLSQPSFCDRWRASPQVRAQVIATDISDLSIQTLGPPDDQFSLLRVTLRWPGNSADAPQEESVLIKNQVDDQKSDDRARAP